MHTNENNCKLCLFLVITFPILLDMFENQDFMHKDAKNNFLDFGFDEQNIFELNPMLDAGPQG